MSAPIKTLRYASIDPILAGAYKIIDQSWLDAGMTPKELERDYVMLDVYHGLLMQSKSEEEVGLYLEQTPDKEIRQKHRELWTHLYETDEAS